MATLKQKRTLSESPIVHRWPTVGVPISVPFPGHEGPRPQLSFVLKTLAGNDCGMTEMHLRNTPSWRTLEAARIYRKVLHDPLSVQIAQRSMIEMMRYLADVWIDSGRIGECENRTDNPSRRNVVYLPPQMPERIWKIDPDDDTLISGWNDFSIPVGASISILFYRLLGNDSRWPEIHEDGTQSLKEIIFGFTAESAHSGYRVALHDFGMKVAMYWFAKLLDSPFSRLLTRCDDCGTYFAYERAPRKEIRGGIHCAECKQYGSAKRMQFTRDKRTKELVGFAADVWMQWKPNSQHGPRSKWIADRVNRRTDRIGVKAGRNGESHFPRITGRWVTEHSEEIQERAEALRHAKS